MKTFLRKSECGSALFIILIGVALFAALGYAVSNMMQGGNPQTVNEEKSKLYAGEILDYARATRQAIQGLRISQGCRDTEISFENNFTSLDYSHTPAARSECTVFNDFSYIPPPDVVSDPVHNARTTYGEYVYPGVTSVINIGTNAPELLVLLHYIKKDICLKINDLLGITNPSGDAPIDVANMDTKTPFQGTFSSGNPIDPPEMSGKTAGCIQNDAGVYYMFYQVLTAR